jgi:hypothetical protein
MQKIRLLQHANTDDTIQQFASSRPTMNPIEAICFACWSREEILLFLEQLLDNERVGIAAYAAIGRAADSDVADLALEAEMGQGAICVLLKKEMAARGGTDVLPRKAAAAIPDVDFSLRSRIRVASRNQARLADMIEDAVLNIFDSKLNAKLVYLMLLHRKQVEQLEILLD